MACRDHHYKRLGLFGSQALAKHPPHLFGSYNFFFDAIRFQRDAQQPFSSS